MFFRPVAGKNNSQILCPSVKPEELSFFRREVLTQRVSSPWRRVKYCLRQLGKPGPLQEDHVTSRGLGFLRNSTAQLIKLSTIPRITDYDPTHNDYLYWGFRR